MPSSSSIRDLVKRRLAWVMGLSVVAMVVTAYLIYQHYKPSADSFCNLSEFFNCDIVNKSTYSEIFGIPVAIFGFLAYVVIFFGALAIHHGWNMQKAHVWLRKGNCLKLLYWFTGLSLLFSLYLTYVELIVLRAACIFCLTQQALIVVIFIILMSVRYAAIDDAKKSGACEFC